MGDGLMVTAVRAELATMPDDVQASAMATMALILAAKIDVDDWSKDGNLRRTLRELRLAARAGATKPSRSAAEPDEQEEAPERDLLDDLQAERTTRRDDLASRRSRRPDAEDHDGPGARPRAAGDGRA